MRLSTLIHHFYITCIVYAHRLTVQLLSFAIDNPLSVHIQTNILDTMNLPLSNVIHSAFSFSSQWEMYWKCKTLIRSQLEHCQSHYGNFVDRWFELEWHIRRMLYNAICINIWNMPKSNLEQCFKMSTFFCWKNVTAS